MLARSGSLKKNFKSVKVKTLDFDSLENHLEGKMHEVEIKGLEDSGWAAVDSNSSELMAKLNIAGIYLKDYVNAKIYRGILTGLNEAFVIDAETRKRLIKEDSNSKEIIERFLVGKDIRRYAICDNERYVIFTRRGTNINNYTAIYNHLKNYKNKLQPKPKDWTGNDWPGRKPGSYKWYEIQDTVDYFKEFEKPKILWPGISAEVTAFAYDDKKFYGNDNNQLIISDDKYLLGILNSKIARFVLTNICDKVQGGFYRLKIVYVQQLPIRPIDMKNKKDKGRHDRIVSLVERMLELNKKMASASVPADKEMLKRQIDATDAEIDSIVYELYGLTQEEIKIVEGEA
jgi:hypothetical protein